MPYQYLLLHNQLIHASHTIYSHRKCCISHLGYCTSYPPTHDCVCVFTCLRCGKKCKIKTCLCVCCLPVILSYKWSRKCSSFVAVGYCLPLLFRLNTNKRCKNAGLLCCKMHDKQIIMQLFIIMITPNTSMII